MYALARKTILYKEKNKEEQPQTENDAVAANTTNAIHDRITISSQQKGILPHIEGTNHIEEEFQHDAPPQEEEEYPVDAGDARVEPLHVAEERLDRRFRRRVMAAVAIVVILLVAAAISVTVLVINNNKNNNKKNNNNNAVVPMTLSPTDVPSAPPSSRSHCTLCYDATIPPNLDANTVIFSGITCAAFLETLKNVPPDSDECRVHQLVGFNNCECPSFPPGRIVNETNATVPVVVEGFCPICQDRSVPTGMYRETGDDCASLQAAITNLVLDDEGAPQEVCDATLSFIDGSCDCPNDPPPETPCTLCYEGSQPTVDLDTTFFDRNAGITCQEQAEFVVRRNAQSRSCQRDQALAVAACGCPELPPHPLFAYCSYCADGTLPTGPNQQLCYDLDTFLALVALDIPGTSAGNCASARNSLVTPNCVCDGDQQRTRPPREDGCALCFDGSLPPGLDQYLIDAMPCRQFLHDTSLLDPTDPACPRRQADAYLSCGCPSLPPAPANATCQVCQDGSLPVGTPLCAEQAIFVAISSPQLTPTNCARFRDTILSACYCVPGGVLPKQATEGQPVCTLCADASLPPDLSNREHADGGSCQTVLETIEYSPTDPECIESQAHAWSDCGCPTLPPAPSNPSCPLCPRGSTMFGQSYCQGLDTQFGILLDGLTGSSCQEIRDLVAGSLDAFQCVCTTEPTPSPTTLRPTTVSPTRSPFPTVQSLKACSLCFGGVNPPDADWDVLFVPDTGYSCNEYAAFVLAQISDPASPACWAGQALSHMYCACPLMPPLP